MANDYKIEPTEKGVQFSGRCTMTGEVYTVTISTAQYRAWREGGMIQNVCPELSAEQREFLISRLTPDEFEALFSEEDMR